MKQDFMPKRKKLRIDRIILAIVITSLFITFSSSSKYKSNANMGSEAQVASPVIMLSENVLELDDLKPGVTKESNFSVTSEHNSKVTQVAMQYTLNIISYSNLPLDIKLYKYSDSGELIEDNILNSENKTEPRTISFEGNRGETHNYKIVVTWDSADNNYKYSYETEYISIEIDSQQLD